MPLPSYFPPTRYAPIELPPKSGPAFPQPITILTFAAAGMTILLALLPDLGHDQQWLLLAATRMSSHLNPYGPTVLESNPPFAIWLSAIVVYLAALLHLSLTFTFKLAVTALATTVAGICAKLLHRLHFPLTAPQLWFPAFAFIVAFGVLPARDFGQRDHLLTLLILPYLLAATLDVHRRAPRLSIAVRILITATAALGIALKPHQALIPLLQELFLLLRCAGWVKRSPAPSGTPPALYRPPLRTVEPIVFLLSAALYLGTIRIAASGYFTYVLPLLRDTYWAFGHLTLLQLIAQAPELHFLLLFSLALNFTPRRKRSLDAFIDVFGAAAYTATFAYYLQGTGWYYQQLPALSLSFLTVAAQLTRFAELRSLSLPRTVSAVTAGLALLALTLTFHFSAFHRTARGFEQPQPIPDPAFFANLPPGTAVATLTTSVDDAVPPAFRYHLTLAQRYPHLWLLPAILRNQSGPPPAHRIPLDRLAALDHLQHTIMVEDLRRWHPTLVLVERCQDPNVHCQVLEDRHDDLLAFFLHDPNFRAIFAGYHLQRTSGPYDAYTLNP